MALGAVWVPVTLLASSAQRLRSAMQRDLIGAPGAAPQVIASALMLAAMRHELSPSPTKEGGGLTVRHRRSREIGRNRGHRSGTG